MYNEEKKATTELTKKATAIKRAVASYKFDKALSLIDDSISLAKASSKLQYADRSEYGGSGGDYSSDYLRKTKSPEITDALEREGKSFECNCGKEDGCECLAEPGISQIQGLRCHFCNDALVRGTEFYVLKKSNQKICEDCDEIFRSAAFPEDAAMRAIDALMNDAKFEIREPYFQYKLALKFLEMARERCIPVCEASSV